MIGSILVCILLNLIVGSEKNGYGTVRAGDLHLCFNRDLCKNLQHKGAIQCIHIHRHGGLWIFRRNFKKKRDPPYRTKKKIKTPLQSNQEKIVTPLFAANLQQPICNYASFSIFIFPNNILYSWSLNSLQFQQLPENPKQGHFLKLNCSKSSVAQKKMKKSVHTFFL